VEWIDSGIADAGASVPAPLACAPADAAFTTSDPQGQWSNGGYFVRSDAWNTDAGPQTLRACAYGSWNVVANEPDTPDVKAYPDVQMDFQASGAPDGSGVPIDSFASVTSTFAETSPHAGIYDYAYDIYVGSSTLVGPGTTEIMIWTENDGQTPVGSRVASALAVDGRTYDLYYQDDNGNGGHHATFVANASLASGTLNLLAFLDYAVQQNWIAASAALNQIAFGVEICETGGASATFEVTDFSIAAR
jgi:hypothetical protein